MKQKICMVGDAILMENFPEGYDHTPIENILSQADARLFNLEMVVSDRDIFASSYCGGTWLVAESKVLDDLMKYGFDGCTFANNHTMDFAYDGMFDTLEAVKEKNIPCCGAGKDLDEASDYIVIDTPNGKTALISICSTFNDAARAGYPDEGIPGRPGLNPLRFSTIFSLTPEHMQALREISAGTHIDGRRNRSRMGGYTPGVPEGMFGFGDYMFKEAESDGKLTKCDKRDIERTVNSIKKAHEECETVMVVFHSHEIKRDTDDEPDDFIVEFAHACIDAGANAVIGTGTHQLKAVEMYKGFPIFYSIGNFIFQTGKFATKLPADFNERYHMPYGISAKEKIARRSKGGTIGLNSDVNNYRSLMPFLTFEDGKLVEMKLYPLRLSMDTALPSLADEAEAEMIGKYLEERNEPFGTKLVLEDGAFVLKV